MPISFSLPDETFDPDLTVYGGLLESGEAREGCVLRETRRFGETWLRGEVAGVGATGHGGAATTLWRGSEPCRRHFLIVESLEDFAWLMRCLTSCIPFKGLESVICH